MQMVINLQKLKYNTSCCTRRSCIKIKSTSVRRKGRCHQQCCRVPTISSKLYMGQAQVKEQRSATVLLSAFVQYKDLQLQMLLLLLCKLLLVHS